MAERPSTLVICVNRRFQGDKPSCAARGSVELADRLEQEISSRSIDIAVERLKCFGHCDKGPVMRLVPGGRFYFDLTEDDLLPALDTLEELCGHKTGGHGDAAT